MCVNANDLDFKGKKNDLKSFYEYSICPFEIEKPKFANFISINFKLDNNLNQNTNTIIKDNINDKDDKNDSFCIIDENKNENNINDNNCNNNIEENIEMTYEDFNNIEYFSQGCIQFNNNNELNDFNKNNNLNFTLNESNKKIPALKSVHPRLTSAIKEVPNDDEKMEIDDININKSCNNKNKNIKKKKYKEIPLNDNLEDNFKLLKSKKFLISKDNKKENKIKIEKKSNKNEKDINNNLISASLLPNLELLDQESLKEECKKYGIKYFSNKNNKNTLHEIFTFLSTKNLPDYLRNNLTNFLNDNAEMQSKISKNISNNSSKNNVNIFNDEKKKEIIEVIKKNKDLWSKILLFKCIDLKEIKEVLTKEKIIVSNSNLKEFLMSLGVVLSGGWDN